MRYRCFALQFALVLAAATAPAQSPTTIALDIASGGGPVTTVPGLSVVTLTATVSAGGAAVTPGQVDFCEVKPAPLRCTDIRLLGTAQLTSSGTATLSFRPGIGPHTYQAVFLGTHKAAPSASAQTPLTVTAVYPTVTEITYPSFLGYGTYTLDVTVTGSGGTVAPTGTVSILDTSNSNYVLATAPLVPGPPAGGGQGSGSGTGASSLSFSNPFAFETEVFGCFNAAWGIFPVSSGMAVADFNGDGKPDAAVAFNYAVSPLPNPNPCGTPPPGTLKVLLGNGDGNVTQVSNATIGNDLGAMAAADFNGDGKLDLAVVMGGNTIGILLGNGDGTFTPGQTISGVATPAPVFIATGDFNGDGIADLAVANGNNGSVTILLGNGDGTFTLKSTLSIGNDPVWIAVGDLNGDGIPDLVAAPEAGTTLAILLGRGDGTFTLASSPTVGVGPDSVAIADFNGDGIPDLGVSLFGATDSHGVSIFSPQTLIMLGNGDGTFQTPIQAPAPYNADGVAVGDYNGDGVPDLAVVEPGGMIWVLTGNGDGTLAPPYVIPRTDGAPLVMAAADFNGDGLTDLAADANDSSSNNSFFNVLVAEVQAPGSSTYSTTVVSDFFVAGTGTHYAVASYSGDANYGPSVSGPEGLTAEPELTTLAFTASPSTSNYGQPVTLTAIVSPSSAQDHTATGSITFTFGSTVIGSSALAGGMAVFTTTMLPAGVDTLTAAYPGDTNFAPSTASTTATVNGSASATTLTASPNPALFGQTITLTAAVVGIGVSQTPTGAVAFFNGAAQLGQATLDSTGHAVYTLPSLPPGTYTLTAAYSSGAGFSPSTSPAVTLVIGGYASTTALLAGPNPAGAGQAVTVTASVAGLGTAIVPSGTVAFFDGPTQLASVSVNPSGSAAYTTAALAVGVHSLTAVYAGSSVFSSSTSPALAENIVRQDFTMALAAPSITLTQYQHTTTTVTLTSVGAFADTVTLTCGNLPAYLTCQPTPASASLAANGAITVSLYLDTDSLVGAPTGPLQSTRTSGAPAILAFLLSPALVFTVRRRLPGLRLSLILPAFLALAAALGLTSCGSSRITPIPAVAPGTYTISITATGTSTGIVHNAQLSLVVAP